MEGPDGDGSPIPEVANKKKRRSNRNRRGKKKAGDEGEGHAVTAQRQGQISTEEDKKKPKRRRNKNATIVRPGFEQKTKKQVAQQVEEAAATQALRNMSLNDGEGMSFRDLGLREEILNAINKYGSLQRPAFIQRKAIPVCTTGRDAIIQAQSGMGKTAALVISVLQRLDRNNPNCQALILVPTRELAEQMRVVFQKLSLSSNGGEAFSCIVCIGGRGGPYLENLETNLRAGCQIVIGTLGQVTKMLLKKILQLQDLKVFALDEADKILESTYPRCTFMIDLKVILEHVPNGAQAILMSATMPSHILKTAWCFVNNPVLILMQNYQLTLDGIRQYHVNVDKYPEKFDVLKDLWSTIEKARGLIFCKSKKEAETVAKFLNKIEPLVDPHRVGLLTGDKLQSQRDEIMRQFRKGQPGFNIIVASDVLGRGIDVQEVNLVINFDLPDYNMVEQYIHRVGRAGRYGRKGIAISLVHSRRDKPTFDNIQRFYQTTLSPLPSLPEIATLLAAAASN